MFLTGIDSVTCPCERRRIAWRRLARDLSADALSGLTSVVGLEDVIGLGRRILDGDVRGRIVVEIGRRTG